MQTKNKKKIKLNIEEQLKQEKNKTLNKTRTKTIKKYNYYLSSMQIENSFYLIEPKKICELFKLNANRKLILFNWA